MTREQRDRIRADLEKRLVAMFGRKGYESAIKLLGRKSASRALAEENGYGWALPDPPPIEEDVSVQRFVKNEIYRQRRK